MDGPDARRLGALVRAARVAAGWRQVELGARCGYSASQISRWETGRSPLHDTRVLRTLARALDVPPAALGVVDVDDPRDPSWPGSSRSDASRPTVGRAPMREEDDVRRRQFLLAAAAAAGSGAALAGDSARADPARLLARRLGQVLLGSGAPGEPGTLPGVRAALATAETDFAACQYLWLADTLPALITSAESLAAARPGTETAHVLAQTYGLTSRALGKLDVSGLHWVAAERGRQAAQHAGDPLIRAESQRLVANVARRAGNAAGAQHLTLAAAGELRPDDPAHTDMWARLMGAAGYAAAQAGDRERAAELYNDAGRAAAAMPGPGRSATTAWVVSHQVSAWLALGDAGTALAHARRLPLQAVPTVERRARLLVDSALAWAQWDKPREALEALLRAEREAPGEVRTRGAVRRLVVDLARQPTPLPQLPALARRVHAAV